MRFVLHCVDRGWLNVCERSANPVEHFSMIRFQRKDIVGSAADDCSGNLALKSHRVNGDDAVLQLKNSQQLGDDGNFVALASYFFLSQKKVV